MTELLDVAADALDRQAFFERFAMRNFVTIPMRGESERRMTKSCPPVQRLLKALSFGWRGPSRMPQDSEMDDHRWEEEARELVRRIYTEFSVEVLTEHLTDRLLAFRIVPLNPECASVWLLTSAHEAIFEAGRGARFELDPLSASANEVTDLALAVAHGGLTETAKVTRVTFKLRLDDGRLLKGASGGAGYPWVVRLHIVTHYPPYDRRE